MRDLDALVDRIRRELPVESWPEWPGGWVGQIELAVLDSVFSIRARYGTETSGVRALVSRYRELCGVDKPNDLTRLASYVGRGDGLAEALDNRQTLSGGLRKAEGAAQAARALVGIEVRRSADVGGTDEEARAWASVRGLSDVTWSYVLMLLGVPGVKADRMVRRFVHGAVGRPVSAEEARQLVVDAAGALEVDATRLDHAIWRWQRAR